MLRFTPILLASLAAAEQQKSLIDLVESGSILEDGVSREQAIERLCKSSSLVNETEAECVKRTLDESKTVDYLSTIVKNSVDKGYL